MQPPLASHEEAVKLGKASGERGIIHHVTDEHNFEDDDLFYRFFDDDQKIAMKQRCSSGFYPGRLLKKIVHDIELKRVLIHRIEINLG